jgi:hypothetical protein
MVKIGPEIGTAVRRAIRRGLSGAMKRAMERAMKRAMKKKLRSNEDSFKFHRLKALGVRSKVFLAGGRQLAGEGFIDGVAVCMSRAFRLELAGPTHASE